MGDEKKPQLNWRGSKTIAPSTKRIELWGWAWASAAAGAVAGTMALSASWRPFEWLPLPPGTLGQHALHWAKAALHWAAPSLFERDVAFYRDFMARLPWAERAGFAARLAMAACAAAAPAVLLAKPMLKPRDGLVFLRGSTRLSGKKALSQLRSDLAARVARRPDHEIAPGAPYPADLWTRHVLVVGGVGSGKSTAVKPLIDKVVAAGEPMILFDPKGEFTSGFAGPAIVAPWDARGLAWDLSRDLRNAQDMRRFAAAMIRESSDPMWSNASRQILVGVLVYLKATRGDDWGWAELKEFMSLSQAQLLPIMEAWRPEAARAIEKASVTTSGILINLSAFCAPIFDLAEAWGSAPPERRISFVEWTRGMSRHRQVILQGHGAYGELTRAYVEGVVGVLSAMANSVEMRDDPNRKLWFIADEFAQMGKIPIRALFEVGRSRGWRCVVACQDFAQLEEIYGAPMVKALVSMCGTLLVGQVMQGDTADQLCKAFGTREVERANLSVQGGAKEGGATLSFAREDVPLYKPSELSSRLGLTPDGKGVILALFTGGKVYELFWPHYAMREERPAHEPAPWTLGVRGDVADVSAGANSVEIGMLRAGEPEWRAGRGDAEDAPSVNAFDRFMLEREGDWERPDGAPQARGASAAMPTEADSAGGAGAAKSPVASDSRRAADPTPPSPMLDAAFVPAHGSWQPLAMGADGRELADSALDAQELRDVQDDLWNLDGDAEREGGEPLADALSEAVASQCLGEPAGAAVALAHMADALFDGEPERSPTSPVPVGHARKPTHGGELVGGKPGWSNGAAPRRAFGQELGAPLNGGAAARGERSRLGGG